MLIGVFVLTICDGDTQNFCFRNRFYFCDITAGTATYKLQYDSDNLSGTDYALYSKLNVSNVSLNIILHGSYSHTESNNR